MSLRIALLGLLTVKGPASGYDLAKLFEVSLNHVWQAGHTQIYPELVKMTGDGLLAVEAEGARGRKIYTITREGSEQLHDWLAERDPAIVVRSETALQAFLLPLLDTDEAVAVVERVRDRFRERLNVIECHTPENTRFGKYARSLGIAQARAALEWAEETLAELTAK